MVFQIFLLFPPFLITTVVSCGHLLSSGGERKHQSNGGCEWGWVLWSHVGTFGPSVWFIVLERSGGHWHTSAVAWKGLDSMR